MILDRRFHEPDDFNQFGAVDAVAGVHLEALVIAPAFMGKRALQRHQLVYATLGPAVGNDIHALSLQVFTPEEYAERGGT